MGIEKYNQFLELLSDDSDIDLRTINLSLDVDDFLKYFKSYLTDFRQNETLATHYNSLKTKYLQNILLSNYKSEYIDMETVFLNASCYLFGLEPLEVELSFEKFISQQVHHLKKVISDEVVDSMVIRELLYQNFYTSFVIEYQSLPSNHIKSIIQHQKVSQYTMGILYLILAEKMNLSIFGLPFKDKLTLCYASHHCYHNEMVYEDDIHFYNIVGEKEISYNAEDIYMSALLHQQVVEINNLLPKGNAEIVRKWMEYIIDLPMRASEKKSIMEKYKKINSELIGMKFS